MNTCVEYEALLDAFADGALTAEEAAGVQAHLDGCPACRGYLDDLMAIRAAFPAAEDTVLPEGFTESVLTSVAQTRQEHPKKQPWRKLAAAAACLCVLVLAQRAFGGGFAMKAAQAPAMASMTANAAAGSAESPAEARQSTDSVDAGDHLMMTVGVPETAAEEQGTLAEAPSSLYGAKGETDAWVEYENVVFSCVVYLSASDVGDLLDNCEGKPYSNARLPEDGVQGIGYALEQADFERILYDELDYPTGPMLNQDRTTELCCIVVTDP